MQTKFLETEATIAFVKTTFSRKLAKKLHLRPVSAPLILSDGTGINDDLNGVERPVSFTPKALDAPAVVVQSLAKWKRLRLQELEVPAGSGILTDMRALRPDESCSPLHSVYVDQWDWEKHILPGQRNLKTLRRAVKKVYKALKSTERKLARKFPEYACCLPEKITFLHAQQLLEAYPDLSPNEREDKAARKYGAVFIIGIGQVLSDGKPHDGRAPDYDDWSSPNQDGFYGLNGDIILWNPVLERGFEISSMGIRVDSGCLRQQLHMRQCEERQDLFFHQMLLRDALPQSIGGGIGQSRVVMFLLRKHHIGEVQVGLWPERLRQHLLEQGVALL